MALEKLGENLKNHKKISALCKIALIFISVVVIFGALYLAGSALDQSQLDHAIDTMEKNTDLGFISPALIAENSGVDTKDSTLTKTRIYSITDNECGFTLFLADSASRPNYSITGKRVKKISTLPPEGFKQISGPVASDLGWVPEVCRYVNLSDNDVIYYVDWYGDSCRFDLFEEVNTT
jgi:hypothetical protein